MHTCFRGIPSLIVGMLACLFCFLFWGVVFVFLLFNIYIYIFVYLCIYIYIYIRPGRGDGLHHLLLLGQREALVHLPQLPVRVAQCDFGAHHWPLLHAGHLGVKRKRKRGQWLAYLTYCVHPTDQASRQWRSDPIP